jgi:hypothetical protein
VEEGIEEPPPPLAELPTAAPGSDRDRPFRRTFVEGLLPVALGIVSRYWEIAELPGGAVGGG